MKRKLFILMLAACSLLSCTDGIWDAIHGLEDKYSDLNARVAYLEELCSEMNTNISALQTLVSVILTNDYIISIAPITKDGQEVGYVITFAIHEPITIYHGQDGQDGANGKDGADGKDGTDGKDGENGKDGADGTDGQDGTTPIIGVALDPTDNAYYWTLNGEWLLDENGNRIPLTSRDGQDGEDGTDGEDGKDGADGQDGKDGITPQLKIEDGYWYVSTDNGATWTQLGKATGEDGVDGKDGQDGADGKDGQDGEKGEKGDPGDTMFQSVTQDDDFVYFTLADGTVLIVPRGYKEEKVQIIDGVIMAEFSVSETKKVYFSMGNLQYSTEGTHKCADGTTQPGTWNFAERQWDEGTFLYWGNSGYLYDVQLPPEEVSYSSLVNINLYAGCGNDIRGTYYDWGKYNAILNGKNTPSTFRLLTDEEWEYLLNHRPNANYLKGNIRVDDIDGIYLLPDSWIHLGAKLPSVVYSNEEQIFEQFIPFTELEEKGVVFLFKNHGYASTSIEERYNMYNVKYYRGSILYNGVIEKSYIARANGTYNVDDKVHAVLVRLVKDVK